MGYIVPYLGIDLGTSNTQIYVRNKGITIDEPSILVADRNAKRTVRAIGDEARMMLGRTGGESIAIRPLADGLTHDFDMTEEMLRYFVRKAIGASRLFRPRAIMTMPSRITPVERRVLRKAAVSAGIRENQLNLVEKSFASALGCGLPVFDPIGSMVVDIGGGSTEVAVISLGGIVASKTLRIGGVKMDEAIINHIKREFNMLIGDRTAEDVKLDLAAAMPLADGRQVRIRGRDLLSPQAMDIEFTSHQAYDAIKEPCRAILAAIKWVLERTPPELAADIMHNGGRLQNVQGILVQLFQLGQTVGLFLDLCLDGFGLGQLGGILLGLAHQHTDLLGGFVLGGQRVVQLNLNGATTIVERLDLLDDRGGIYALLGQLLDRCGLIIADLLDCKHID